jgi:DNA-binding transcriptional LysR family regulator
VPGFSLGAQVARIERDLGGPVLIRATEHHPLRLTSRGKKVVAAVTALQKAGWPAAS